MEIRLIWPVRLPFGAFGWKGVLIGAGAIISFGIGPTALRADPSPGMPAAAQAVSDRQFDVVCNGTVKYGIQSVFGGIKQYEKPALIAYSINLDEKRAQRKPQPGQAQEDFAPIVIQETPTTIYLGEGDFKDPASHIPWLRRTDGFISVLLDSSVLVQAICEKKPFTGIARPKF